MALQQMSEEQFNDLNRYISKLWQEIHRCEQSKAYLAGSIMAGALLEALLLAMVDMYPEEAEQACQNLKQKGKMKGVHTAPSRWSLTDLLYISFEAGWIPFKDTANPSDGELGDWLLNFVREIRNWVHPGKKIREYTKMRVTKERFKVVVDLVEKTKDVILCRVSQDLVQTVLEVDRQTEQEFV